VHGTVDIAVVINSRTNQFSKKYIKTVSTVSHNMPVDACPVNRTLERSLWFALKKIIMKIFKTNSEEIVTDCQVVIPHLTRSS